MSESSVEHPQYDQTAVERIVRMLGRPVSIALAAVLPVVLLTIVWVAGELAERILVSFSGAAGQKFHTDTLGGFPVWLGTNFANVVKVGLWAAAFALIGRGMLGAAPVVGPARLQGFVIAGGLLVVYSVIGLVFDFRRTTVPIPVLSQLWAAFGWLFGLVHDAGLSRVTALLLAVPCAVGALFAGVLLPEATVRLLSRVVVPIASLVLAAALGFVIPYFTRSPVTDPLLLLAVVACVFVATATKTLTVALREFKAFLLSPLGYGLLLAFTLVAALTFHFAVHLLAPATAGNIRTTVAESSALALQPLAAFLTSPLLSLVFLLLFPIVTMHLGAEEKRTGTLEVLMTSPVREWNVIAGKFLGVFGFYMLFWAIALVHIALLHWIGLPETAGGEVAQGIDFRQVLSAYLGLALMGVGFLAMGLFCSCLVGHPLAAAVLTLVGMLPFTTIPFNYQAFRAVLDLPASWAWVGEVLSYLDVRNHLEWSARGTPDSRTVFLFLSMAGMFLFAAVRAFEARRWTDVNYGEGRTAGKVATALTTLILVGAPAYAVLLWKLGADFGEGWEGVFAVGRFAGLMLLILAFGAVAPGRADVFRAVPAGIAVLTLTGLALAARATSTPDLGDDFNYTEAVLWATVTGLAALIIYLVIIPRLYAGALTGKLVYGANVFVCMLGALFIGVMINYLAVRYHVYLDWSAEESFSLHPASTAALAGLPPDQRAALRDAAERAAGLADEQKKIADGGEGQESVAGRTDALAAAVGRISAGEAAREELRNAHADMKAALQPEAKDAAAKKTTAATSLKNAKEKLEALLPDPAIPDGDMVRVVVFVGRYDPPKDRTEVNDNFRRDTLERLLRRFADSLNRPGNVKIGFGTAGGPNVEDAFLDPRSERRRDELRNLRNRWAIEGNRDILLLYHDRQFVVTDDELFTLELTMRRFTELTAAWNREFERGERRSRPPEPTEANLAKFKDPKSLPVELMEYQIRDEELELTVHKSKGVEDVEQVLTNAILRIVRGHLNILYFTQGHGERDVFPGAERKAKTKAGLPGAEEKDREKDDPAAGADPARRRLTQARAALQKRNFQVRSLNRFGETVKTADAKSDHEIPADCRALVICDPTEDFLKAEIEAIERYMKRGGKVVLMLDPRGPVPNPFTMRKDSLRRDTLPNLIDFAARYGVEFEDTIAVLRPQFQQQPGGERPQVYMTAGEYRFAPPQENRWYNEVLLAQKDAGHDLIRRWMAESRKEAHLLFPGVVFNESRTLRASGKAEFTPVISLGKARTPDPSGRMPMWDKMRLGASAGPEPAGADAGAMAVMAVGRPKDEKDGAWTLLAIGDADFLSDGIAAEGGGDEDSKDRSPTYLQLWHRGGEKLLIAAADFLCSGFPKLEFVSRKAKPYQAQVERTVAGELLVTFRADATAEQVQGVVEIIRRNSDGKLDELTAVPHDLRRMYEFRFDAAKLSAGEAAAKVRAIDGVADARAAPEQPGDRSSVLVEFPPGTPAEKVRAAAAAAGAADTLSRTVRNQWRFTFDDSKTLRSVRPYVERAARWELKSEILAGLADIPEDVRKKLEFLKGERLADAAKFEERLAAVLSPDEVGRHRAALVRAAEPPIADIQPRKAGLLVFAAVVNWGALPLLVIGGGAWVMFVRRRE